ncbi:hypothetical protein HFN89_00645 [Rhizobium laguerreae]|nr:hypothetical protein [Rhizobium laguerreae]
MITDAKLRRLMREAAILQAKSERLDAKITAAANSEATWIDDRSERFTEWFAYAVGVPIAFVMIVWNDFVDWIDDAIWKLKNRRHGGSP